MQRKSKYEGVRQGKSTFSPHFFAEDVTEALSAPEPAPNSMENLVCSTQPNGGATLLIEDSNCDGTQSQSGATHSGLGQAASKSTDIKIVGEVDVEEGCTPDVSRNLSACKELCLLQVACKGSNFADPKLEAFCNEDPKTAVSEPYASPILAPSSTSTAVLISQAQIGLAAQDQGSTAICSTVLCQVPDSSEENFSVLSDKIRLNPCIRCLSKVGEIQLDCSCDSSRASVDYMDLTREDVEENGTLTSSISDSLPNEHIMESTPKLAAQKSMKRWRRKGSVHIFQPEHEVADPKVQEAVVDKRDGSEFFQNDISRYVAGTSSLPSSPKALSQGSVSLSTCVPAAFSTCNVSVCDDFADASMNGSTTVCLVNTESDISYMSKNSKKGVDAGLLMTGVSECAPGYCSIRVVNSFPKTSSGSGGQTSLSRIVSCGGGKKWRPKLSGANGHDGARSDKLAAASAVSGLKITQNDCSSSLEASKVPSNECGGKKSCQKPSHNVDYSENVEGDKLSRTVLKQRRSEDVSLTCESYSEKSVEAEEGEFFSRKSSSLKSQGHTWRVIGKQSQKPIHNAKSIENVEGVVESKLLQAVLKQRRLEDIALTRNIKCTFERPMIAEEEEFNPGRKNINRGNQSHTWRVIGKQMGQRKSSPVSWREDMEHSNSFVKKNDAVNSVQGALKQSWMPKQLCSSHEESFDGAKDKSSNLALQNKVRADWKEHGNRRPFSMKNFLNDDNRKVSRLQQPLSFSSIHKEHDMVGENFVTAGIDYWKGHSSGGTYMKLGKGGELHVAKVDRRGWVVKTETARSMA